ncbi:serine hydrolase [Hymenobacter sp. GOD-10R]|uniref:serine hydrolase n=1 Tax=Hymenobacter sp. GOD-10R TaxID=3093922 RepID=UPI002D76A566|nr:serine hydrolase [Hymenobacter sp. GOD-10R]WRQ28078.1 serine hydrolase [Hymenobacter sp. GOD-10R]
MSGLASSYPDQIPVPSLLAKENSNENKATGKSWLLDSLLHSDAQLAAVVNQAAKYELQIIYTQIDRDEKNQPHFTQHNFQLDAHQYFDPASLVKLPTAIVALEKVNSLRHHGLTRRSPMATGVAYRCQTPVPFIAAADSDYQYSIGNYIKRMLLVSDNNAYNRLYEFVGQRPLNERLASLGYSQVRIVRRFAPCDTTANRHTNPVAFYDPNGHIIYSQEAASNTKPFDAPIGHVAKGKAYKAGGKVIRQPYDLTTANYLPLQDITDMLKAVMFPTYTAKASHFSLTNTDYQFLRYYLHHTPHSSGFIPYHSAVYFDAYKKYLYYGRRKTAVNRPDLRIYNIVGMSHGYLADVAYIADSTQHAEFMLSCVLYTNEDGIINDGVYEYTTVGLPFMERLGKVIYKYEVNRSKRYIANLSEMFSAESQ